MADSKPFVGTLGEYLQTQKSFDINSLPLNADMNAVSMGRDELGQPVFKNRDGSTLIFDTTYQEHKPVQERLKEATKKAFNYVKNPVIDTKAITDFAGEAVKGVAEPFNKMALGKGTIGDLTSVVGTVGTPVWTTPVESGAKTLGKTISEASTTTPNKWTEALEKGGNNPPDEIYLGDVSLHTPLSPEDMIANLKKEAQDNAVDDGSILGTYYTDYKKVFDSLDDKTIIDLAKDMPHWQSPDYVNYKTGIGALAKQLNISTESLNNLISDVGSTLPKKDNPLLDSLTEKNLPKKATIGTSATEQLGGFPKVPKELDKKANDLGFNSFVYHTSTSPKEFTEFSLDKNFGDGSKKAAQDLLGVHVGTPRAAAERHHQTSYFDNKDPKGFTMELRARTDKPVTKQDLISITGADPNDFDLTTTNLSEIELNDAISSFTDQRGIGSRTEAAIELRKELAKEDYTHIPYTNNVEDKGSTSFIMLVDRPKDSPAVLRDSRAEFDPKKVTNPDLRFAEGGTVNGMEQQMNRVFASGGINTTNQKVDPVSGNEVPPGSLPEEVRDDVPAKLSGGEYVVPADVLRYFGVSFFEKLRAKAKAGLEEMNSDGRIGGSDGTEEEDLPFSVDELQAEDMPDEQNFATGGLTSKQEEQQMLNAQPTFNPNVYGYGGNTYAPQPYIAPVNQVQSGTTTPTTPTTSTPTTTTKQGRAGVDYGSAEGTKTSASGSQSEGALVGGDWAKNLDFTDTKGTLEWANDAAKGGLGSVASKGVGAVLGAVVGAPTLGAGVGGAINLGNRVAEIRAAARLADDVGNTQLSETLKAQADKMLEGVPTRAVIDHFATGDKYYKAAVAARSNASPTTKVTGSDGEGQQVRRGVTSTTQGTGSDGSWSSAATRGSTAPTSSPKPQARPTTSTAAASRPATQSYTNNTTGANATRRAKGGLISKPKKKC